MTEQIDHPNHYNNHPSGVECIEIVEHMPYNIGNAVAYLWRYQDKHEDPTLDLKKAMWHIQREIEKIENAKKAKLPEFRVSCFNTVPKTIKYFSDIDSAVAAAIKLAEENITYTFEVDNGKKVLSGYTVKDGKMEIKGYG